MTVPAIDYAALSSNELAVLKSGVGGLSSLERVIAWGRSCQPARGIEEILRRWKPTPSGLKTGPTVLGYAACVFERSSGSHTGHHHE
jgi:hypothetical protein